MNQTKAVCIIPLKMLLVLEHYSHNIASSVHSEKCQIAYSWPFGIHFLSAKTFWKALYLAQC